jgi:hypothetical protein
LHLELALSINGGSEVLKLPSLGGYRLPTCIVPCLIAVWHKGQDGSPPQGRRSVPAHATNRHIRPPSSSKSSSCKSLISINACAKLRAAAASVPYASFNDYILIIDVRIRRWQPPLCSREEYPSALLHTTILVDSVILRHHD